MLNLHGAIAGMGVAALLAGCAAQPPAPPMAAPAAAAAAPSNTMAAAPATGGLDGVYRGPDGGTGGNAKCSRRLNSPIRVVGGVASIATAVTGIVQGPVGPDGSLALQSGPVVVSGRFANGTFTGSYSNNSCVYTLNYAKR